jgi:hypothetical protein
MTELFSKGGASKELIAMLTAAVLLIGLYGASTGFASGSEPDMRIEKVYYDLGESVFIHLMGQIEGKEIFIVHGDQVYRYAGDIGRVTVFTPKRSGNYTVKLFDNNGGTITAAGFEVEDIAGDNGEQISVELGEMNDSSVIGIEKVSYAVGEGVRISLNGDVESLDLLEGENVLSYLGSIGEEIVFIPKHAGEYTIRAILRDKSIVERCFLVFESAKGEEGQNQSTVKELNKVLKLKKRDGNEINYSASFVELSNDSNWNEPVDVELVLDRGVVESISFRQLEVDSVNLKMDTITEKIPEFKEQMIKKAYAIDPTELDFTVAEVTSIAVGSELHKCRLWNYDEQSCDGAWEKLMDITPGERYSFNLTPDDPGFAEIGLVTINTHKSIYLPNESAFIALGILDHIGHIVCDANVTLHITDPSGAVTTLTTMDGDINISDECDFYGVTNLPDYYTNYQVNDAGVYEMNVTAETYDGYPTMISEFLVSNYVDFDVTRIGPTRIYPMVPYLMNFSIFANRDFSGLITEIVPKDFTVFNQPGMSIIENESAKLLVWNESIVNGSTYNISYSFDAPDITPELYELGPLKIGEWEEFRRWQIASDGTAEWADSGLSCTPNPATDGSSFSCTITYTCLDGSDYAHCTGDISFFLVEDTTTINDQSCISNTSIPSSCSCSSW